MSDQLPGQKPRQQLSVKLDGPQIRYCGFWGWGTAPAQIRKADGPPLAGRYTVCALWAPECKSVDYSRDSREEPVAGSSEHGNVPSGCVKGGKLDYVKKYQLTKERSTPHF